ncbi:hypothetical protein [Sinosporangium album]|uniref:hypothetical protein n=1 Tax=Sinosporangium album TaxID=504805 RepID=UPI0015A12F28|nr:hypothetical protein [Sinosporangium album]
MPPELAQGEPFQLGDAFAAPLRQVLAVAARPWEVGLPPFGDRQAGEAERVRDFRRLIALGWFLQLGPDGPATPHNPVGTLECQADRVLQLLG